MRMRGGLNRLAILAMAMALAVPAGAAHAYDVDARAEAVINRSKAARQTYAVYEWTRMTPPGRPLQRVVPCEHILRQPSPTRTNE